MLANIKRKNQAEIKIKNKKRKNDLETIKKDTVNIGNMVIKIK